ncbi:G-protein coupled receptor Mth2-like [Panulirus ornatus]|uniref:G-protein coupled receptor Mth2-like n=1 Tax=Panulirus ornatus TaxID=150431 RepID=UPI003A88AC7C
MNTWTTLFVVGPVFLSALWAAAAVGNTTETTIPSVKTPITQISPISDLFSNTTLRKCRCGADEALDGFTCVQETTLVGVLEITTHQAFAMNTSAFSSVTVAIPECPDSIPLVALDWMNQLLIMSDGTLLWHGEKILDDYCVEHILQDGHSLLEAFACVPPPPVPRCCPPGHVLSPDNSCIAHSLQQNFSPPIVLESHFPEWKSVDGEVKDIKCEEHFETHRVKLNVKGRLFYSFSQAVLSWKPTDNTLKPVLTIDYCVGVELDGERNDPIYVARTCYMDRREHHRRTCTNNTCIRKCCPEEEVFSNGFCDLVSTEEILPSLFKSIDNQTIDLVTKENFTIVDGLPLCDSHFSLNPQEDDDKFYLMANGFLHVPIYKSALSPTDYCVDYFRDESGVYYSQAVLCHSENEECLWRHILIVVLLGVSCVFLAATALVYLGVPELRDRTNGRCLISMVSAMFTTYITLICNQQIKEQFNIQCIILAFVGHVSTLATFFWLNVMCYDMWCTLRSSHQQHHSMKRFLLYSAYAWGCPLAVGVITVIIDSQETSNLIRPRFTESTCWFYGDVEYWLYLQGIICILVFANLFFFVHVAVILASKLKQRRAVFETSTSYSSNATKTREQAWLYIKLFIVMGVVWIADVVSSVHHRKSCTYWITTDIINGLQGVFIFLVAVCNKDNIKKIRAAWCPRIESVQTTISAWRGKTTSVRQNRNLSVTQSESSRKTSVTSLPRKISVVSGVFFPSSNKTKRATQVSDASEASRKSSSTSGCRKVSTASNREVIPMTTMNE